MVSSGNVATIHPTSCTVSLKLKNKKDDKKKQHNVCLELTTNSNNLIINKLDPFRWFPSYRMMTATMLCFCFAR